MQRFIALNQKFLPEDKYRGTLDNSSSSHQSSYQGSFSSQPNPYLNHQTNPYLTQSNVYSHPGYRESRAYSDTQNAPRGFQEFSSSDHQSAFAQRPKPIPYSCPTLDNIPSNDRFDMTGLGRGLPTAFNDEHRQNFKPMPTYEMMRVEAADKEVRDHLEKRIEPTLPQPRVSSQSSVGMKKSSLLGLTDISARLEATLSSSHTTSWTPLGVGSAGTPSKTPSPNLTADSMSQSEGNPIEQYIFLSDDEEESVNNSLKKGIYNVGESSRLSGQMAPIPLPESRSNPPLPIPLGNLENRSLARTTSWSQVVRTTGAKPIPFSSSLAPLQLAASPSPGYDSPCSSPSLDTPVSEFHRGPKVDPRWPVTQQVFLGPIPVSVTWDEIRNTFYNKVARHQILHTYVQSKPVNDVVYGQIVFDKSALAIKVLKEGPIKVRHRVLLMKE